MEEEREIVEQNWSHLQNSSDKIEEGKVIIEQSCSRLQESSKKMLSLLKRTKLSHSEIWHDEKERGYGSYYRHICSLRDRLKFMAEELEEIEGQMMKENFILDLEE